jgi:hypothetical protein
MGYHFNLFSYYRLLYSINLTPEVKRETLPIGLKGILPSQKNKGGFLLRIQ